MQEFFQIVLMNTFENINCRAERVRASEVAQSGSNGLFVCVVLENNKAQNDEDFADKRCAHGFGEALVKKFGKEDGCHKVQIAGFKKLWIYFNFTSMKVNICILKFLNHSTAKYQYCFRMLKNLNTIWKKYELIDARKWEIYTSNPQTRPGIFPVPKNAAKTSKEPHFLEPNPRVQEKSCPKRTAIDLRSRDEVIRCDSFEKKLQRNISICV